MQGGRLSLGWFSASVGDGLSLNRRIIALDCGVGFAQRKFDD